MAFIMPVLFLCRVCVVCVCVQMSVVSWLALETIPAATIPGENLGTEVNHKNMETTSILHAAQLFQTFLCSCSVVCLKLCVHIICSFAVSVVSASTFWAKN